MAGMIVARDIPGEEGTTMSYRWPDDTVFSHLELHVEEQWCQTCGGRLRVCDSANLRVCNFAGPLSRPVRPGPPRAPQSGSRNSPGHALVGLGLGCGVLSVAAALRPSLR